MFEHLPLLPAINKNDKRV